jgi:integrase
VSIKRVERGGRRRYEVRWREQPHNRSRLFDRHEDAQAWQDEVRRRRQLGPLAVAQLTTATPTLGNYISQRWGHEHAENLEQSTRDRYASVYTCHVAPWLDEVPLAELTVARLREWQAARVKAEVNPGTIHKARTMLSSVLRHAAESEVIAGNPLTLVRAPKAGQRDAVQPLAPRIVEAIRRALLDPPVREVAASRRGQRTRRRYELAPSGTPQTRQRDALIVSLLAYAGLRPGELRALRWADVGKGTIHVQRAASPDGSIKATKTAQRRIVRLLSPLALELREYQLAAGRPPEQTLLLPREDGGRWTKTIWQMWRADRWAPACHATGLEQAPRPYDLRHSFCSLLLAECRQPVLVAKQAGHSLAVLLSTYAHLIEEYAEHQRVDPEREILEARNSCTPGVRRSAS